MKTRTVRISSNYYAIKVYFIYGTYPAYFNYQIVLGEIQYSFTTSINIALFYTLEERKEAELYLYKNLKN